MARKVEYHTREIARVGGTDTLVVIDRRPDGTYDAAFTEDGGKTLVPVVAGAKNSSAALMAALRQHPDGRRRYEVER